MNQKVKVAIVNEGIAGGIHKHIFNLATSLNPEVFDITVFLARRQGYEAEGDPIAQLQAAGVRCLAVSMAREISPLQDLKSFFELRKLLRDFDIIHAHSAKAGFLSRWISRKNVKQPCFYSPHVFAFQRSAWLSSKIYLALEKLAGKWTNRLIVNSPGEKATALKFALVPEEKIEVVCNAIEPPEKIESPVSESPRKIFLTVGRLVPYKGHAVLLQAFAQVLQNNSNAELWIAGEGKMLTQLQSLAKRLNITDSVRFLGYRKNVYDILNAADCFVLASQNEGCPYTILEALALEKPIIATAVQGTTDLLANRDHCLLVPWNNPEALASAMLEFLASPFPGKPFETLPAELFDLKGQISKLEKIYLQAFIEAHPEFSAEFGERILPR